MKRGALFARLLVIVAALGTQGTLCSSGPDCSGACDAVLACPTLNKTFLLSCSTLSPTCDQATALCAVCINSSTCDQLVAGGCDCACVPGIVCNDAGMPLDGGTGDAGMPDAGSVDGGVSDAGQ